MSEGTGGMDIDRLISIMGVMMVVMAVVAVAAGVFLFIGIPLLNGDQEAPYPDVNLTECESGGTEAARVTPASLGSESSVSLNGGSVEKVDPFLPEDPEYYGAEITSLPPPVDDFPVKNLQEIYFEEGIELNFIALSYNVDVSKGPLVIVFSVTPDNDYYEKYNYGRLNPYLTFMYIKVYDRDTGELVAGDGYLRQYSADEEKEIVVCREGDFRVDIYGRKVSIDLSISTGV